MTNTLKLKSKIEKSGYKLSFIAQKIGISRGSLYEKINNRSPFNQFEIQSLCKLLHIESGVEMKQIFFDRNVDTIVLNTKEKTDKN